MKELSDSVNKDKKLVINLNNTRIVNYNSSSFLKGLYRVKKQIEKDEEMSKPDSEKMYLSYNI